MLYTESNTRWNIKICREIEESTIKDGIRSVHKTHNIGGIRTLCYGLKQPIEIKFEIKENYLFTTYKHGKSLTSK